MIDLSTYACLKDKEAQIKAIVDGVDVRYKRQLAKLKQQREDKINAALKEAGLPTLAGVTEALSDEKMVLQAQVLAILKPKWDEGQDTKTVKGEQGNVTLPRKRKAVVGKGHERAVIRELAAKNKFGALKLGSATEILKALDALADDGIELSVSPEQVTIVEEVGISVTLHKD